MCNTQQSKTNGRKARIEAIFIEGTLIIKYLVSSQQNEMKSDNIRKIVRNDRIKHFRMFADEFIVVDL